jgi:hypothetical protein
MSSDLLYPMFFHVAWTALIYALLTLVRAPTVWGVGAKSDGSNPWADVEPRVSANLSNQFEWPLFFYVVCIVLMIDKGVFTSAQIWLAWIFIAGRVAHSFIHIFTSNVRLRGVVFTVNFLAVLGMWGLVFLKL